MDSGNHVPTSFLINHAKKRSTSDKVDDIISTLEDIISTFKTRGCPEGKQLLREILIRNHLLGGSPLEAASQGRNAYANQCRTAPAR
jgi:hypothetical protein